MFTTIESKELNIWAHMFLMLLTK